MFARLAEILSLAAIGYNQWRARRARRFAYAVVVVRER